MMKNIKDQVKLPTIFRHKNISAIYKNKGSKGGPEE